MTTKLHLGCGRKYLDGYINIDGDSSVCCDMVADVTALDFRPETVDEILAIHVFEHIHPIKATHTLTHWWRLLKPGGALILEMPSLTKILRNFQDNPHEKLTQTGQRELTPMTLRAKESGCPLVVWPKELEDACREFVGADPGTGIRILWFLRKVAQPRAVCCYGMDCWEAPSHWSGRMNTPNHSPNLEREAMLKLL